MDLNDLVVTTALMCLLKMQIYNARRVKHSLEPRHRTPNENICPQQHEIWVLVRALKDGTHWREKCEGKVTSGSSVPVVFFQVSGRKRPHKTRRHHLLEVSISFTADGLDKLSFMVLFKTKDKTEWNFFSPTSKTPPTLYLMLIFYVWSHVFIKNTSKKKCATKRCAKWWIILFAVDV